MSVTYIWLLVGVMFLVAEAMGITGIGLLFAGLGAIIVGTLVNFHILADTATLQQFIVFFIATAAWAAFLWKPMQQFQVGNADSPYSNIVGETAYVGSSGINKVRGGEVTWSGTIMMAELEKHVNIDALEAGSPVTIVKVEGTRLIVKPKE